MSSVNLSKQHPGLYQQVLELSHQADEAMAKAGLDPLLAELVKIRISQLNGCAFCLKMHTHDAITRGETADRLAVLPAWWESQYFTDQEQAALALAEQTTRLSVPAPAIPHAESLTEEQASAITWLAIVMNSWNRIAVCSHYPVGP